jgi:23S rRNA (uridine2552-2'-O)-methyltransferase
MYRRKDSFYRKAKAAGLRSRAAFKLEDLGRGLIRPGARVLDLGSWPGGWLQIARRLAGERGRVVGVDLRETAAIPGASLVQGDAADPAVRAKVRALLGGPADVVLSDMAPKLTGIPDRDEARSTELVRLALAVARELLRPGGAFLCKLFMNADYETIRAEARESFDEVSATRSEATRKGSAEMYLIARGLSR